MAMLKLKNFRDGFTLIELLIIVVMVAMVAGISISNFRQGERQKRVAIAADVVTNAVRNAQNFTLTGKKTRNSDVNCRTPRFYYIQFFYSSSVTVTARNNCGTDDVIETYPLPANTRIKAGSLMLNNAPASGSMFVIFFPPFATIQGNRDGGANAPFATETITVESSDGTSSKVITIDGVSGRIGE